jgi:hypothetical protein
VPAQTALAIGGRHAASLRCVRKPPHAREILRRLVGTVRLVREKGGLFAELSTSPGRLLPVASANRSGGLIPSNSTTIVAFSSADRRRKIAVNELPDQCGNGHRLTPDNVRIDRPEGRWRCRQCGCDRAAAFRDRQRTG